MSRQYLYRIGYEQGVKPSHSPIAIPERALWDGRNLDIQQMGLLSLRPGAKPHGPALGVGKVKAISNALGYPVAAWGTGIYRSLVGEWSMIAEQLYLPEQDVTFIPWTLDGESVILILLGTDIYYTDGTFCTLLTAYSPQNGEPENLFDEIRDSLIGTVKVSLSQRMVLAKDNYLYLSAPLDPSYFPADQVISLPNMGNNEIVTVTSRYDALVIYRTNDRWAFFGSDLSDENARLILQDNTVGCLNRNSIQDVPNIGQIFAGPDNIYVVQGVSAIENQSITVPIGGDILNYYKQCVEQSDNMASIYYDNQYYLAFPDVVEPERVFRLRPQLDMSWFVDTGPKVDHMVVVDGGLYGTKDGQLLHISNKHLTDGGVNIPYSVTFRHEVIKPGPVRFKKVFIYLTSDRTVQSLHVSVVVDGVNVITQEATFVGHIGQDFVIGEGIIGVHRIGRIEETLVYEIKLRSAKGHAIQVSAHGAGLGEDVKLLGYSIEYKAKRKERGTRKGVTIIR